MKNTNQSQPKPQLHNVTKTKLYLYIINIKK